MAVTSPEPAAREVVLAGLRFRYREWGEAKAPRVLLLHGFTGHARQWDDVAADLAAELRVLALDQRGHGDTQWADYYGSKPMVADVAAFVDVLHLAPITLVGLSMGGINAYCYTGEHAPTVERLVVVDVGPEIARPGLERILSSVRGPDTFASVDEAYEHARAENPRADPAALRHRVEHDLRPAPDGRLTWKYDPRLRDFTARRSEYSRDEQWDRWRRVRAPTLLVRGAESDVLGEETARRMLDEQPRAELVTVEGAGHTVTIDRPEAFRAALREWLARQPVA